RNAAAARPPATPPLHPPRLGGVQTGVKGNRCSGTSVTHGHGSAGAAHRPRLLESDRTQAHRTEPHRPLLLLAAGPQGDRLGPEGHRDPVVPAPVAEPAPFLHPPHDVRRPLRHRRQGRGERPRAGPVAAGPPPPPHRPPRPPPGLPPPPPAPRPPGPPPRPPP